MKSSRELVDTEQPVGSAHKPVSQSRLREAGFVVEGGTDPIPGFEHLPRGLGITALIAIGQAELSETEKEEQTGQQQQDGKRGQAERLIHPPPVIPFGMTGGEGGGPCCVLRAAR